MVYPVLSKFLAHYCYAQAGKTCGFIEKSFVTTESPHLPMGKAETLNGHVTQQKGNPIISKVFHLEETPMKLMKWIRKYTYQLEDSEMQLLCQLLVVAEVQSLPTV